MNRIMVLSLVALGAMACASSRPVGREPATQTVRIVGAGGGSGELTLTSNDAAHVSNVPFPVDDIWRVLPAVYTALGIPLTTIQSDLKVIGNEGFTLRRRLGDTALSRFLECGRTQIDNNADTYEVHLVVLTQIRTAAPLTTTMATSVQAAAKPLAFAGDYSKCSSKGELEKRIDLAVKARLQP